MWGSRAVVTGGLGFIGSAVAARLVGEGYRVLVLDRARPDPGGRTRSTYPGSANSQGSDPGYEILEGDVTTAKAVRAVEAFKPSLVVHAAAQTRVPVSVADPLGDAHTNIRGTLQMLEGARLSGSTGFVFFSSAAIYGDAHRLPIPESLAGRPLSPYGLSKLAATRYVQYYRRAGLLPTLTIVPANAYGPGQTAGSDGGVIAKFVEAAARGEPLPVEGDGSQTRDFIYVDDIVEAVWLGWRWLAGEQARREAAAAVPHGVPFPPPRLVEDPAADATFNVSTGRETSIARLAEVLERVAGRRLERAWRPPQPGAIQRSCLSPELARSVLGWAPTVTLEEGLARTLAWRR